MVITTALRYSVDLLIRVFCQTCIDAGLSHRNGFRAGRWPLEARPEGVLNARCEVESTRHVSEPASTLDQNGRFWPGVGLSF